MDETAAQATPAPAAAQATPAPAAAQATPAPAAAQATPAPAETAKEETPAPVVPEKYEFKLPEGISMSPEIESKFTAIAKEARLTQAQADSLIKMHSDIVLDVQKQAETMKTKWADECRQAGLSTPENLAAAKLVIDTFGGGEVMQTLVDSGLAFNPGIQRMLQNIGKLLREDNAPDGKSAAMGQSAADLLFANSKYE